MENVQTNNEKLTFIIAAYEQCFNSKHHYDSLSWVIGGVLLVFVGAFLTYLPQVKGDIYLWTVIKRIIIAGCSCTYGIEFMRGTGFGLRLLMKKYETLKGSSK